MSNKLVSRIPDSKGFTLGEAIVSVLLTAQIFVILYQVFDFGALERPDDDGPNDPKDAFTYYELVRNNVKELTKFSLTEAISSNHYQSFSLNNKSLAFEVEDARKSRGSGTIKLRWNIEQSEGLSYLAFEASRDNGVRSEPQNEVSVFELGENLNYVFSYYDKNESGKFVWLSNTEQRKEVPFAIALSPANGVVPDDAILIVHPRTGGKPVPISCDFEQCE